MFELIKKIHRQIPSKVKDLYMPTLYKLAYVLGKNLSLFYPVVYFFEGEEKDSRAPLSFVYAGFNSKTVDYWAGITLVSSYNKRSLGRQLFNKVPSFLKANSIECDFLLMEHNRATLPFLPQEGFRVPYWVSMEIDTLVPQEELLGEQQSDIKRRIRKNGLSFIMTKDIDAFNDFYDNMFLPYIQDRHTFSAFVDSREYLFKIFQSGELILIKKDEQVLAGGIVEYENGYAKFRRLGVRGAKWEYVQYGVLGAMYYFLSVEMKKRGCPKMHIGGTRPFLSDGVTKFKISLAVRLDPVLKHSYLLLVLLKESRGVKNFFVKHPFIFVNKENKSCRAVFMEADESTPLEKYEQALKMPFCKGMAETHMIIYKS